MDKRFLQVDDARWRQAQAWELETWLEQNRSSTPGWLRRAKRLLLRLIGQPPRVEGDDWNVWWATQFENYRALPAELDNVIELGCGPYTNMRLICQARRFHHIFCSDPLARHYVTFEGRWLAEAWKQRQVLIDDHPIEKIPFASDYFDLVVMINVLDHVQDAALCLNQARRLTKVGGYLIVGQDLTSPVEARALPDDLGHPIRVDQAVLESHLLPAFTPILLKNLPRAEGRNPQVHDGTWLFIGQKLAVASAATKP